MKMTFGEMVRSARLQRGLTIKQVAGISGISYATIQQIEGGRTRSAGFYHTLRICAALEISLEEAASACLHENLPRKIDTLPDRVQKRLLALKGEPGA